MVAKNDKTSGDRIPQSHQETTFTKLDSEDVKEKDRKKSAAVW